MRKYRTIDYAAFGNRIAKRRMELHRTQKDVAEKLECNESYISKIENGKAQPTFDFIYLLAQELNVSIDYFVPGTAVGTQIILSELQFEWQKCSPEVIQFIKQIIIEAQQFEKQVLFKGNHA